MRQDPDIIMVWEVRDEESAELFVESSLTWHMWFTTTHAKTWCWAFDRLKLMWVKPYLIVWGVTISMSQRLSQKLCNVCKYKVDDPVMIEKLWYIWDDKYWNFDFTNKFPEDICTMIWDDLLSNLVNFQNIFKQFKSLRRKIIQAHDNEKIEYKQKLIWLNNQLITALKEHFVNNLYQRHVTKEGEKICDWCQWKGVKWRVWVFEFIETTKELEQLVLEDAPLKQLETYVRENNVYTLDRHWIVKAMRGEIDFQELQKLL
jgi:type II secretory ATPase GspE/PulE/Tfp pilus assembly ATPase PilB-like protein